MAASDQRERARQTARRASWRVLPLGRRAREAARRAQRLARHGAIRAQRAVGQQAAKFRRAGRIAAVHVISLQKMAKLPASLMERSASSVLERKRGPLPDPAWVAGYRDVVMAELHGMARPVRRPEPEAPAEGAGRWAHDALGSRLWREGAGAARDEGERAMWAEWDCENAVSHEAELEPAAGTPPEPQEEPDLAAEPDVWQTAQEEPEPEGEPEPEPELEVEDELAPESEAGPEPEAAA